MCLACDEPCWRSGGPLDCDVSEKEYQDVVDTFEFGLPSYEEQKIMEAFFTLADALKKSRAANGRGGQT